MKKISSSTEEESQLCTEQSQKSIKQPEFEATWSPAGRWIQVVKMSVWMKASWVALTALSEESKICSLSR